MPVTLSPQEFVAKWRKVSLKESSAAQSHFNDLCRLLGERETGLYKTPYYFNTFFSNRIYKGELWFGGTLIRVDPVVTA